VHNIFTYWEGSRPLYIEKCLKSISGIAKLDKNIRTVVLTPNNVGTFLKDAGLHDNWTKLKTIAHRADCIRVAVMCKYGGLYVDADTVFLKSPSEFLNLLTDKDFYFMRWDDGRIMNGYFYCKALSDIMQEWLLLINQKLRLVNTSEPRWTEFGEKIIMPIVYGNFSNDACEIPRHHFLPVNIDKIPHVFFERVKLKGFDYNGVFSVALNHSFFCDHYKEFIAIDNEKELTDGDLLIHDIMRRACGK